MTWELVKKRTKQYMKSWTLWFNTGGAFLLMEMASNPDVLAWAVEHNVMVYFAVANILLRFKTKTGLHDK